MLLSVCPSGPAQGPTAPQPQGVFWARQGVMLRLNLDTTNDLFLEQLLGAHSPRLSSTLPSGAAPLLQPRGPSAPA